MKTVKVGIGVIIAIKQGNILVGKRCGSHACKYSIPGGHMETGEHFEDVAIREIKEETNLVITSPKVIAVTNNLQTYKQIQEKVLYDASHVTNSFLYSFSVLSCFLLLHL